MPSKKITVSVKDIHKEFVLPQSKNSTFKQTVVNIVKKNNKVTQKTLDGVSFDVHEGDFFGIVGRNGSGKSTLLKLIAGVYAPTKGSVGVYGGLTPFIELGVGFNPELSGRDNVYLNGALLGFTRSQMDAMYEDIVAFAELEPFMDQKLKNYSSGMQVRLAFSIAVKAKNDILIFDEVLAVGDEAFQRKCLDVFEQYKANKQTVILVTHDMDTVKAYCNRAILISNGKVVKEGNPQRVADEYSRLNMDDIARESLNKQTVDRLNQIALTTHSVENIATTSFAVCEQVKATIQWSEDIHPYAVTVDLFKKSGEHVTNFKSIRGDNATSITNKQTSLSVMVTLEVSPGRYYFVISLRDEKDRELETLYDAGEFIVTDNWDRVSPNTWSGLTFLPHRWSK